MKPTPHLLILLGPALPLLAAALLLGGCGDDRDNPDSKIADYLLDPPTLAAEGFPPIEDGVPVFCYHYFRSGFNGSYLVKVFGSVLFGMPALGPREFWTTPVGEFEKHLRYFRDSGTAVMTLDEIADLVEAGQDLPEKAVVLTIDDADRSVYQLAWPLLEKYGMRAHLFVPTGKVGTSWSELEVCSWDELAEMADSGTILVESHTRDLHFKIHSDGGLEPVFLHPDYVPEQDHLDNLSDLSRQARENRGDSLPENLEELLSGPYAAVAADLMASRVDLTEGVGIPPRWLAWPYGFATAQLDSLSKEAGFRGTVSLFPEAFTTGDSTLTVGRFALTAKSTTRHIAGVYPD